jgi:hypothetical protein
MINLSFIYKEGVKFHSFLINFDIIWRWLISSALSLFCPIGKILLKYFSFFFRKVTIKSVFKRTLKSDPFDHQIEVLPSLGFSGAKSDLVSYWGSVLRKTRDLEMQRISWGRGEVCRIAVDIQFAITSLAMQCALERNKSWLYAADVPTDFLWLYWKCCRTSDDWHLTMEAILTLFIQLQNCVTLLALTLFFTWIPVTTRSQRDEWNPYFHLPAASGNPIEPEELSQQITWLRSGRPGFDSR